LKEDISLLGSNGFAAAFVSNDGFKLDTFSSNLPDLG
jgi:hypothetical protein